MPWPLQLAKGLLFLTCYVAEDRGKILLQNKGKLAVVRSFTRIFPKSKFAENGCKDPIPFGIVYSDAEHFIAAVLANQQAK